MKCTKTEYFSHGVSNFASDFPSRQACQNAVNHVLELQIYMFLRIDQVLRIFTKINGIIRDDIEGNVLIYRVVIHNSLFCKDRVISPFIDMTLPIFERTTQSKLK